MVDKRISETTRPAANGSLGLPGTTPQIRIRPAAMSQASDRSKRLIRSPLGWPDTTHTVGQEAQLVAALVAQTGVVLVAWEYKKIAQAILPAIANGQTQPGTPAKWDGTRFDVVLRFSANPKRT
jgi:hypothetical protein